jgi:hypothetical protein
MLSLPTSYADLMKTLGLRDKGTQGSLLHARMWLVRDFPLNLSHLLLVLRVVSVANARVRQLVAVLEQWKHADFFSMKVHIPLFLSLYAQVVCLGYRPLVEEDAPEGWFDVPGQGHQSTVGEARPSSALDVGDASNSEAPYAEVTPDQMFGAAEASSQFN